MHRCSPHPGQGTPSGNILIESFEPPGTRKANHLGLSVDQEPAPLPTRLENVVSRDRALTFVPGWASQPRSRLWGRYKGMYHDQGCLGVYVSIYVHATVVSALRVSSGLLASCIGRGVLPCKYPGLTRKTVRSERASTHPHPLSHSIHPRSYLSRSHDS